MEIEATNLYETKDMNEVKLCHVALYIIMFAAGVVATRLIDRINKYMNWDTDMPEWVVLREIWSVTEEWYREMLAKVTLEKKAHTFFLSRYIVKHIPWSEEKDEINTFHTHFFANRKFEALHIKLKKKSCIEHKR